MSSSVFCVHTGSWLELFPTRAQALARAEQVIHTCREASHPFGDQAPRHLISRFRGKSAVFIQEPEPGSPRKVWCAYRRWAVGTFE